jgi:large subunit ribosomal protein L29
VKAEKLRELSPDELHDKERELHEQLFRLRFQKALGQLDDPFKLRLARRDIARIQTILREKRG